MKAKKVIEKSVVLLFLFLISTTYSQRAEIKNVSNAKNNSLQKTGIYYGLPKSTLFVTVEITKESSQEPSNKNLCADLFGDCNLFFGAESLPYSTGNSFKVSDVKVKTVAQIDPTYIYSVDAKKKWNRERGLTFSMNPKGVVTGATITDEDKTFDLILTTIQTLASIAAKSNPIITSTTAKHDSLLQPWQVDFRNRILGLLAKRENLISSNNYGSSKETLEYQVKELNKIIAKELTLVLGTRTTSKRTFNFVIENPEINHKHMLFFLKKSGAGSGIGIDDLFKQQNFVPKSYKATAASGDNFIVDISATTTSMGEILKPKLMTTPPNDKGMAYRIPGEVEVKIFDGIDKGDTNKKEIYRGYFLIAQLGSIAYLPYKIDTAEIEYYEELGWIKTVKVTGKAVTSDQISAIGNTINSVRDVLDGDTELERLTKEVELLKLRQEYQNLLEENEN